MLEWSLQSPNGEAGVGAVDQDLEGRGMEVRGGEGGIEVSSEREDFYSLSS